MPNWCIEEVREFASIAVPFLTPWSQYLTKALPHLIHNCAKHIVSHKTKSPLIVISFYMENRNGKKIFLVLKLRRLNLNSQTVFITINLKG